MKLKTRLAMHSAASLVIVLLVLVSQGVQAQMPKRLANDDDEILGIAKFGRRAELTFGSAGRITELHFDEGNRVQQGDLLATLYDETAKAAVVEARERANATGALLAAEAQLSAAKERLAAVQRANQHYANAFSPQAVRDLCEAVDIASEAVRQQRELVEIAAAGEETAQSQLDSLRLIAPFSGTIVRRLKSAGEGVDPVSPVYELIDDTRVRIEFFVPENRLANFSVGSEIRIEAMPKNFNDARSVGAKVDFLDLSIQPVRRVVRAWCEIERPSWIMDGTRLKIASATDEVADAEPISSGE